MLLLCQLWTLVDQEAETWRDAEEY